jgi:hypothetical protein
VGGRRQGEHDEVERHEVVGVEDLAPATAVGRHHEEGGGEERSGDAGSRPDGEGDAGAERHRDEHPQPTGGQWGVEPRQHTDGVPSRRARVGEPGDAGEGEGQPHDGVGRDEDAHHGQPLGRRHVTLGDDAAGVILGRRGERHGTGHVVCTSTPAGVRWPSK